MRIKAQYTTNALRTEITNYLNINKSNETKEIKAN